MDLDEPSMRGGEGTLNAAAGAPALMSPFLTDKNEFPDMGGEALFISPKSRSFTDSSGASFSIPTTFTSGSPQSVISTISSESDSTRRFKHYQKPTAASSPTIIQACEDAISSRDVETLASIARNQGVPPHLRKHVWRILLKTHPYVLEPQLHTEFPTTSVLIAEKIPVKRINAEVKRLRQRVERRPLVDLSASSSGSNPKSFSGTRTFSSGASSVDSSGSDDEFYDQIGDAVKKFLEIHGDCVRYDPAMIAVAYSLAQATGGDSLESDMFVNLMLLFNHTPARSVGPCGPDDSPVSDLMFQFVSAMRELLPAVAKYFDSEDVLRTFGGDQWLVWWLRWFGAKTFWPSDLARLWDIYIAWRPNASDSPFPNNPSPPEANLFACLAVMKSLQPKIMDLDQSEIRQLLANVPASKDIESIIEEAVALASKWYAQ